MIKRNEYQGELALGRRIKTTVVASLDAVTETTQIIADSVTTARSVVELVHGALQPAIMEQRIEYAKTAHQGILDLTSMGMSKEDAHTFLQIPYVAPESAKAQLKADKVKPDSKSTIAATAVNAQS